MVARTVWDDDLDGKAGATPRTFCFQSFHPSVSEAARARPQAFTIDLCDKNWGKLEAILAHYSQFDKRSQVSRQRTRAAQTISDSRVSSQEIRDWAKSRGLEVNSRGKIPSDVVVAYEREHGGRR